MNTNPKTRLFLGASIALALAVSAGAARAVFTPEPLGGGGHEAGETTISVRTGRDAAATVVRLPELAVGESRTVRSESGKDVVVTRQEDGLTLSIDGRQIHVNLPGEGAMPGHGHGEDVKTTVSGDVKKVIVTRHGYGFSTGDGDAPALSAAELLEKHNLDALAGADARTKETVAKALEELVKKGAVIAPGLEGLPGGHEEGDRVEIRVTKKGEK